MRGHLIFAGDDTLWTTEPLYDNARSEAAALVHAAGFDPARWDAAERSIDVANVARFGMGAERFPTSCVEALDAVAASEGRVASVELREAVRTAAAGVFRTVAPLVDGAAEMLAGLSSAFRLVLVTKGDDEVQCHRIDDSGLAPYFDLIRVVPVKDVATFRAVGSWLDESNQPAWSIGNSLSSDVFPAMEAGMRAIWIDAHVWEYERRERTVPNGVWVASRLTDVPAILDRVLAPIPG